MIEAGERGVEYSNALIWENTLIFGTTEAGLVALYPELGGAVRWVLPVSGGVSGEISLHGSQVYFGGSDGYLYCVNIETGKVSWRYETKTSRVSKPTVQGARLYVTSTDDVLHAVELATGRGLWAYRRKTSGGSTVHGASQPWTDGKEVIAGMSDGYLVTLDAQDGRLKSERRLSTRTKFADVDASPVLDGEVFYVGSYDGELHALKKGSLETLWKIDAGASRSVRVAGDQLFVGSSDGFIRAIDKASGKVLWKFELDDGVPGEPVLTERWVLVASTHQYLYVLDRKSGELIDRWNAGYQSGFSGNLAYDGEQRRLYVVSGAANLYSFSVR
jgi:outer membrane protein assembly factor BamB